MRTLASAMRVLMVIVLLAGLIWAARAMLRDYAERNKRIESPDRRPAGGEQPST